MRFLAPSAHALEQRTLIADIGVRIPVGKIVANVLGFLSATIIVVCLVLFVLGAFYFVLSRGKEDQVKAGRDLMMGSLIGLAITLGAYGILRTLLAILYYA